jgi:dTDP-glucose 4,6-dehydratase
MQRALVTGAGGFIGSHLVERLVRDGVQVRAFVRYTGRGDAGWLDASPVRDAVEIVRGDIRDSDLVRRSMKDIDTVFHLAALIGIPYSYESPLAYVRTNVEGTLNVLDAARDLGVQRVVHTSTSEVYGTAQFVPIREDHPLVGQSPYSASKIGADQMAVSFQRSFGLPVIILRPFNTYGPRQSTRAVIPTIISQLLRGDGTLKLGALHPTRDFNFVTDTAAAFVAAAKAADRYAGEVINAGSNFEVSIADTASIIAEALGREWKVEQEDARLRPAASEVERLWADNSRAREWLGWTPVYGGLEGFRSGIAETVEWFRDPANLARYVSRGYDV